MFQKIYWKSSLKQIHEFAKINSYSLEFASRKMIEQNQFKLKTKLGLSHFLILSQMEK